MKKVIIIFFLLILNSFIVNAALQVKGYVYIEIINEKPKIVQMFFHNEEVYEDSNIRCDATVEDEYPENVIKKYSWFVNNNELSFIDSKLPPEFFEKDDIVTCKIIPNDLAQDGEPGIISVTVKPIPVTTKVAKGVLSLVGTSTTSEELASIRKEQGTLAVTGFVVKEFGSGSKGLAIPGFILVMMVLFLITVNLVLRTHIKRHRI